MAIIKGVRVAMDIQATGDSRSQDALFLGVVCANGGREFPLHQTQTHGEAYMQDGNKVRIRFGDIDNVTDNRTLRYRGIGGAAGEPNDPALSGLDFDAVSQVYIRKAGTRTRSSDDFLRLDVLRAELESEEGGVRKYVVPGVVELANERGEQVWLREA